MKLSDLKAKNKRRRKKRAARGIAGFRGKTAGRGTKGQKSRSGYNIPRRFEGGQMPLIQRLPKKRGFQSSKKKPAIVNLAKIEEKFPSGATITPKILQEKGLVREIQYGVKILGKGLSAAQAGKAGKLTKKIKISGCLLSKSVKESLELRAKS